MEKNMSVLANEKEKFYRFQVFQGELDQNDKMRKTKSVGMAYLKEGQNMFTLRLWTFVTERFYLILNQNDASKYLVMTREPNKNPLSKNKYFWNIVGHGLIDTVQGIVKIEFDLFEKPVYMSTHPESSAYSNQLPEPDGVNDAA